MLHDMNTSDAHSSPLKESPEKRNSLRQRHVEQTREVILGALTEQLAKEGFSDFDIPSLARRAGVSVRTIYRHFGSRDALLEALALWVDEQVGGFPPRPMTVDEVVALPMSLFPAFDEHETIIRAQTATDQGRAVRARGRRQHLDMYQEALREVTAPLPPSEAASAVAVITYLLSSQAWRTLREEHGMDGEESGRVVSWAVRTLLEDLAQRKSMPTAEASGSADRSSE